MSQYSGLIVSGHYVREENMFYIRAINDIFHSSSYTKDELNFFYEQIKKGGFLNFEDPAPLSHTEQHMLLNDLKEISHLYSL
ncbi:hypothetical protein HPB58_19055 [Priestia filamentosa]|jgi:hypothetical protein|uniref:hypothetical protein n=1 Tax=Priestia TaxID=2800373 RepID=UPI000F548F0B|nr:MULTISPECIES: hypothetical protein [Priestia]MCY8231104.1 hypothetical protein [Priestia endophytica]MED3727228.1 hypothetical protein [Priestia filamentosa]MED4073514.1 hypothetical protein [Priestia endophytica]RPK13117.1 hypothetical protein FH5_03323 [Priestia endophytica]UOE59401.1 hypothetical protein HPB58_19055 [Priestia filamentosa]